MPKYLFQASYTVQGEEGVRAKGGSDRRDAVADTMRSAGGELECLYFEFGDRDAFAIVDLPDDEAAAAVSPPAGALTTRRLAGLTAAGWSGARRGSVPFGRQDSGRPRVPPLSCTEGPRPALRARRPRAGAPSRSA
jgi:uncharacterized protein with GYD domain